MYRFLLVFAAGFVLAAVLFNAPPLTAQNKPTMPPAGRNYINQAAQRLGILDSYYVTISRSIGSQSVVTDVVDARANLVMLIKGLDAQSPPIDLLALHTQLRFAAFRCESLALMIEGMEGSEGFSSMIGIAPYVTDRASCLAETHHARMRLIDYAASYGVHPFR